MTTIYEILKQLEIGHITEAQALQELREMGAGAEAQFIIDVSLGRIDGDIEKPE